MGLVYLKSTMVKSEEYSYFLQINLERNLMAKHLRYTCGMECTVQDIVVVNSNLG